ncbi:MAG TPA: SDR family oxidoreductase [Noviherbaspirillum sp.]|nr:SDR family oxidoreductase [Noviherbaspirillum sp.]
MNILVCGANGFIGRHICDAFTAAGHSVRRGVRRAVTPSDMEIDFMHDVHADDWLSRLQGIDVVVNAVGILCERADSTFASIHRDAPMALIDACERAGVRQFVQISALGNDSTTTPYMRTKREADAYLMASRPEWTILRPSLVVGMDGASSRFFRMLASLPVVGLPGRGDQRLQPVHVDDLCEAVVRCLDAPPRQVVNVVGPEPMTYRTMLEVYRAAMNMRPAFWLSVPMGVMRVSAAVAARLPQRVFSPDTLRMLEDGNLADSDGVTRLLGHPLKGATEWFADIDAQAIRWQAMASWAVSLLRVVLAMVWIATGIVSLWLYPTNDSLALIERVGLQGSSAQLVLYGAAVADCVIGFATLIFSGWFLWRLQIALILAYTAIITVFLPEFWLHPFGPVLKNLPILAILVVLESAETH